MTKRYSTKEICAICGVTRKQLRYYEERGMLTDVHRNKQNNYRFYENKHILEIVAVKEFLSMGLSLQDSSIFFRDKKMESFQYCLEKRANAAYEEFQNSLARYDRCVGEYARLMQSIALLKIQIANRNSPCYDVTEFPGCNIISLNYKGTFMDTVVDHADRFSELQKLIEESSENIALGSIYIMLYDHFNSRDMSFDMNTHDYKIAFPVLRSKSPIADIDRIKPFRSISTLYIQNENMPQLLDTYKGVLKWGKEHGYNLSNHAIEEWLISPLITTNHDFWLLRLHIPIVE